MTSRPHRPHRPRCVLAAHRDRETRHLTAGFTALAALGCAAAVLPSAEHAITLALTGTALLLALTVAARRVGRWVRERREDRADARTAARWQAVHAPHLLTSSDVGGATGRDRAGVA